MRQSQDRERLLLQIRLASGATDAEALREWFWLSGKASAAGIPLMELWTIYQGSLLVGHSTLAGRQSVEGALAGRP
jgi:hypothetical protein